MTSKKEHLIDVAEASRMGCSMLVPVLLSYVVPYLLIWKSHLSKEFFVVGYLDVVPAFLYPPLVVLVIFIGIILHEGLHGLAWSICSKAGWASIRFGIMKPSYTPYCHCIEPLRVRQYIFGALTPLFVLGMLPAIYALITGNWLFLIFGFFFTVTAVGDVMIVMKMRKLHASTIVLDHPSEAGFYVLEKR
ncbi:DUF3267 domain-containing protein [Sphingobacterium corticis]|uniref:DUF3267 domain-containing protein n=1 Tax=Sphingobacterium corticis TaxID=1812823 RepID=A0ABW5NI46_9SPHI